MGEMHFEYVNYRGEKSHRCVRVISMRFGASEYHTTPQWLMLADDLMKGERREFAMADMSAVALVDHLKVPVTTAAPLIDR